MCFQAIGEALNAETALGLGIEARSGPAQYGLGVRRDGWFQTSQSMRALAEGRHKVRPDKDSGRCRRAQLWRGPSRFFFGRSETEIGFLLVLS